MTSRSLLHTACRTAAGACALFVTIRGFLGAYGIEFRTDTLISTLYVAFPCSSFFIFFFARRTRVEVVLHALIALGYLGSFSFLNWRTCASFGYCTTVADTVFTTLAARPVLAAFGVVAFSAAALLIANRGPEKSASHLAN